MRNPVLMEKRIAFAKRIVDSQQDIGKTKLQKISYFLQESLGVELMYPFRIHYFGPYSDELDNTLALADSVGIIDIEPDLKGFGYHVTPSERETAWALNYDFSKETDMEQVDTAINVLGKLEVSELELYATIHFIGKPETGRSKDQTLEIVKKIKPRFLEARIDQAYDRLKESNLI